MSFLTMKQLARLQVLKNPFLAVETDLKGKSWKADLYYLIFI